MTYSEYYLAHHGVKGMKWGIRRKRSQSTSKDRSGRVSKPNKSNETKESPEIRGRKKVSRILKNIGLGTAIGVAAGAGAALGARAIGKAAVEKYKREQLPHVIRGAVQGTMQTILGR